MCKKTSKKGVQYSLTQGEGVLYNKRPTNGITKATLYETTYDVVDIIERSKVPFMVANTTKYELQHQYSATTSCLANEEYNEEKGKDMAKRKVLKRYNSDKIAKIDLAIADLKVIIARLERQRKIASERVARDEAFLDEEHSEK
jgi:hypothetical protein